MKKSFVLVLILLLTFSLMVSCGGSKENEKADEQEQVITFHDIQISLPEEYVYDEESNDDTAYYKVVADEKVQKMVMLQYVDDANADFSNSDFVEGYEKEMIDGETFYDGSGMEKVAIDNSLYAYETSCSHDGDNGTQDVEIMAFNDSDHNMYSIIVATNDGSSKEQMQSINDSFRYSFTVAEESEEEPEEEPEKEPEEDEPEKEETSDAGGVTPEFKEAMDEYEKFFDEYADFMESYKNGEGSITEYAEFMSQYSETMEKLEAVDDESLSPADEAYYLEVMNRINKRLAEVAY